MTDAPLPAEPLTYEEALVVLDDPEHFDRATVDEAELLVIKDTDNAPGPDEPEQPSQDPADLGEEAPKP